MLDPLKKLMLAGLGATFLTREKVEAIIQKMVTSDQLSKDQARKMLDELAEKGKAGQEALSGRFHDELSNFMDKLQTVKRDEFDALKARVEALESQCQCDPPGTAAPAAPPDAPCSDL